MSEQLNAAILATLKNATGQKPTPIGDVLRRVLAYLPDATPDQVHDALEHLHAGRALNRARIIRADIDHEVWWPTCVAPRGADIRDITIRQHTRADAARAASQHQQDLAMSKKPVTKTDQLLKCLAEHGPLYANQLAEKTGLQTRNIDSHLVSSMRNRVIATRQGYVPERRRHMKHYMTQDQAAAWDARQQTPTADIPTLVPNDQGKPRAEAGEARCSESA